MQVKMGSDGKWKKAAMSDDTMVAELLLRLNKATPTPTPKPALSLEWSVRQRRSKAVTAVNSAKKTAPRASPATPLSWSGATSQSGGGGGGGSGGTVDGGSEESSKPQPLPHPKRPETARSKATSEATTGKRPRKKKTLAELKEEEILLLKERRQLKKELATLRVNLDKQRATNENLKKMKLDLQSQPANERGTTVSTHEAISGQIQNIASSSPAPLFPAISPAHDASLQSSPPKSCSEGRKEVTRFVLPDLNLPFGEDCNTEVLCGVS